MHKVASLVVRTADGKERRHPLVKRLVSVGRSADNDVVVEDPALPDTALHLQREGERLAVVALDGPFLHNGKRRARAWLEPGDVVSLGSITLTLAEAAPDPPPSTDRRVDAVVVLDRLHAFSQRFSATTRPKRFSRT